MIKVPMTTEGFKKIQDELRYLKNVERPRVVSAIASARELGDISENAEYHAAKDKQGMTEARIADLEDTVSKAEVIDASNINVQDVRFGATVILVDVNTDEKSKYRIVGSYEADIKLGLLPITSPLAKALIGKQKGEIVEVLTPGGSKSYEIMRVEYSCT
jgi:transcription elongation factor GreA